MNKEECIQAKDEFIALMKECGNRRVSSRISLDLSHIGLSINSELAYENLLELAKEAQSHNLSLMISMEESTITDQILSIYKRVAEEYANVRAPFKLNYFAHGKIFMSYWITLGQFELLKGRTKSRQIFVFLVQKNWINVIWN